MNSCERQQCLLGALGEYTLRRRDGSLCIDGLPGPATKAAIRSVQLRAGLAATGLWNAETEKALRKQIFEGIPAEAPVSFWEDPEIRPYFKREEFRCPCPRCGGFPAEPEEALVRACAEVRRKANAIRPGTVFAISSGVRCQAHNDELPGSARNSRHLRGRAVDFCLPGISPGETLRLAKSCRGIVFAYIMPSGWVHMDIGN